MGLSRPLIAAAGAALAAIAVVGVGAGATFTTSAASSQKVTAGTVHVSVSASNATCTSRDASGCHALTLQDVGPVGSTFDSTPTIVTVKNTGNIPVTFNAIQISATHNNDSASAHLFNEMNVCIKSTDPPSTSDSTWVEGNGPLTTAVSLQPTVEENPLVLHVNETFTYQVEFYAGEDSSCGTVLSDGPTTRARWAHALGGHGYSTPASLNNDAMGGVVTPTLTFSFNG